MIHKGGNLLICQYDKDSRSVQRQYDSGFVSLTLECQSVSSKATLITRVNRTRFVIEKRLEGNNVMGEDKIRMTAT